MHRRTSTPAAVVLVCTVAAVVPLVSPRPAFAATVSGRVVGPDKKPVAGASVLVLRWDRAREGGKPEDGPVKTDADGRFAVEVPEPKEIGAGQPRPKAGAQVVVHAPGFALVQQFVREGEDLIELAASAPISGVVRDGAGKPVAGLTIALRTVRSGNDVRARYSGVPESLRPAFSAKTDAAGRWRIAEGVPTIGGGVVTIEDPRYVSLSADASPSEEGGAAIVVRPAGAITGRVVDAAGKPVADAAVHAFYFGRHLTMVGDAGMGSAKSGPDGSFRIGGLGKGTFKVSVTAPGAQKDELVAVAAVGVEVADGKETALSEPLALTPGALVEGTVVDATDSKPLPNVHLYSHGPHNPDGPGSGWSPTTAVTDAQGRYRLRVAAGAVSLRVGSQSFGYKYYRDPVAVTVRAGETKNVEPIRIPRAVSLQLSVVDPQGAPVPGLPILVHPDNWGMAFQEHTPKTDANGVWDIRYQSFHDIDPDPNTNFRVVVPPEWEVVEPSALKIASADAGTVKVVVRKADLSTRTSGRVVTPVDQPIPGVRVNVYSYLKDEHGGHRDSRNEDATTGPDGVFRLPALRPGVVVILSGYKADHRWVRGGEVTVPKESKAPPTVTDLVLAPLTATVSGRVVNATGKPVPGAWVWSPDGDARSRAKTDAQGRFTLSRVPAGDIAVGAAFRSAAALASGASGRATILTLPAAASKPAPPPAQRAAADAKRAMAILRDLAAEAAPAQGPRSYGRQDALANLAARYDLAAALRLGAGKDGGHSDDVLSGIIENRAPVDPAGAAALFDARRGDLTNPKTILHRACDLGMVFSDRDAGQANRFLRIAAGQFGKNGVDDGDSWARLRVAALALRLRSPQAEELVQRALEAAKIDAEGQKGESARIMAANLLARGDVTRSAALVEPLPAPRGAHALFGLAQAVASDQPAMARRLLERALGMEGAVSDTTQWALGQAIISTVRAMGASDPAAAASLARRAPEHFAAEALAMAGAAQTDPTARAALFKEAVAKAHEWERAGKLAELLAVAERARAADVAARLRREVVAAVEEGQGDANSAPLVTYVLWDDAPALCRMHLEATLPAHLAETRRMNPDREADEWLLRGAVSAMALLDPERALEIADGAGTPNVRHALRREVARVLLLPPARRTAALSSGED